MVDFDPDKNIVRALIQTTRGATITDGEYGVFISQIVGLLGEGDFELVKEAISDCIDDLDLPIEGWTEVTLIETGEREDVFWNKYYQIVSDHQIFTDDIEPVQNRQPR